MENKTLSVKEEAIYNAVLELFHEGADLSTLTVAEITGRAGIGKGTAYEYFSNKEEMIAKALFYKTQEFCTLLYNRINKEKSLFDKIESILEEIEEQTKESNCLLKFLNIISDHSEIGRRMHEMMEGSGKNTMLPMDVIRLILQKEIEENGKEVAEESLDYLEMELFSKIICYGMFLCSGRKTESLGTMRKMICEGFCKEMSAVLV